MQKRMEVSTGSNVYTGYSVIDSSFNIFLLVSLLHFVFTVAGSFFKCDANLYVAFDTTGVIIVRCELMNRNQSIRRRVLFRLLVFWSVFSLLYLLLLLCHKSYK